MSVGHSRACEAHHLADCLLHLTFVTVYRTIAANGLGSLKDAALQSLPGVQKQIVTLLAELITVMMSAAIHADHHFNGPGLLLQA